MATNVRINLEDDVPEIFKRSPGDLALEEKKKIEQEIRRSQPPEWAKDLPPLVGNVLHSSEPVWLLAGAAFHVCLWLGLIFQTGWLAFCAAILAIWFFAIAGMFVIGPKDLRKTSIRFKIGVIAVTQIPVMVLIAAIFCYCVELFGIWRGWDRSERVTALRASLGKDPVDLVRARYQAELTTLGANLLGVDSPLGLALEALRTQLSEAKVQLERINVRRSDAETRKEQARASMLGLLHTQQQERIAALTAALGELEWRKHRANAFLLECNAIVHELSGVAGDELLAREIHTASGKDAALIAAADEVGRVLVTRLGTAFKGLQAELAEQELNRLTGIGATLSSDALLGDDFDARLEAATKRANG